MLILYWVLNRYATTSFNKTRKKLILIYVQGSYQIKLISLKKQFPSIILVKNFAMNPPDTVLRFESIVILLDGFDGCTNTIFCKYLPLTSIVNLSIVLDFKLYRL